jgi:hypothetical protein
MEAATQTPEGVQRILFFTENLTTALFMDFHAIGKNKDRQEGSGTDKTVPSPMLMAMGTFQEIGIGFVTDFKIGRNRGFRISRYGGENRNQIPQP